MEKLKNLYTTKIKDYRSGNSDIEFSVFGVFDSHKVHWKYYLVSHTGTLLTSDICSYGSLQITSETCKNYGKSFNTKEEAMVYLTEFKDKWELGSNDTRGEKRDKKLTEVLGETGINK
jgi:hypothetical protein